MTTIEDLNYHRDPRAQGPAPTSFDIELYVCRHCNRNSEIDCECDEQDPVEVSIHVPTRWVVCPVCRGKGTHVNPSIDCGGLGAEDFDADPDFAEAYMRGDYDEPCRHCGGRTTILAPDLDELPKEQAGQVRDYLGQQDRLERECRAEYEAELRMGA